MRTFRKLRLHSKISGQDGNCRVLDSTTVLHISSSTQKRDSFQNVDVGLCQKYGLDIVDILQDHDNDMPAQCIPLTKLVTNVVTYISGFVVKMLCRTLHCDECIFECFQHLEETYNIQKYEFLSLKNRGEFETQ